MVDRIRALSEPKTLNLLCTPSDNRARNFCSSAILRAFEQCVSIRYTVKYLGLWEVKEM
jgi:hypothetical protein